MFTDEYRIKYYTKNIIKKKLFVSPKDAKLNKITINELCVVNVSGLKSFLKSPKCNCKPEWNRCLCWLILNYVNDSIHYIDNVKYENKYFYIMFGDNSISIDFNSGISEISKIRRINDTTRKVILNLNYERHCGMLKNIKDIDIPFNEKNNKLIWRGISSGGFFDRSKNLRKIAVEKFQNHQNKDIDIKFTELFQGFENESGKYILSKIMPISEQLQSKFLLSIEGNDVATNLKWILLSNSVCLMPVPRISSWFMEDHLVEFKHYVPIRDDFMDLEEKYEWCLNNLDKCEEISRNATLFIQQFLDETREKKITDNVVKIYFDNIDIVIQEPPRVNNKLNNNYKVKWLARLRRN